MIVCGWEDCVINAASAEWGRVVVADGKRYRVCCEGLVGAAFACELLSESHSGICVEIDVLGAAAVALVGSSAACGRGGRVLIVGHFVYVLVDIIKTLWSIGRSVCRMRVSYGGVFVRNYVTFFGDAGVVCWFVSRCVGG